MCCLAACIKGSLLLNEENKPMMVKFADLGVFVMRIGDYCVAGGWPEGCAGVTAVEGPAADACDPACGPRVWFAITSSNSSDLRNIISIFGFCTALSRPSSLKASSPVVISAAIAHPTACEHHRQTKLDDKEDTWGQQRERVFLMLCIVLKPRILLYSPGKHPAGPV